MIVAIVGPTGVGKTKLSENLAKKYNGIIINADSVQMYKELNIGSAKPKENEKEDVPHYLFDKLNIIDEYNIFNFQKDIRKIIDQNTDKNIFIVGGSGLYLTSALYDYKFTENKNNINYDNHTNEELYKLVKDLNIETNVHVNNRQRLISYLNNGINNDSENKLLYDVSFVGLTTNRDLLYKRINQRVIDMLDEGLINEVENLYQYKDESKILKTAIGYKEVIEYLDKTISKENMIESIQKNSRHYAKRQYTWFNNKLPVNWFDVSYDDFGSTIKEIEFSLKLGE